jgi:soluble lytic murein transglycosylase
VEAYRRIYFRSPAGARADEAKAALDRLLSGAPYGSTADELARAERLFAARRWNDARAAFAALATTVSGGDRTRVVLRLAASETRLGRARAARDRLKPLLDDPEVRTEAQYLYGGALRALGDGAAYELVSRDLVERAPTSAWAVEALNDLAVYHLTRDEDDTADHVFRELLDRYPQHRYAERAAWKVGWAAYRSRRFADTIQVFESASTRFPRSDYRPSWVYWSARAREQMGDRSGAASLYQVAVADYGSSYYGRLAARLLAALPASAVASRARATRAPQASGAAPPTAVLFQTLMAAGLYDDALREVQFAQRTWGDSAQLQATSAWIRHQQARDLRGDGRFAALRGAITTMRRAYPQVLAAEGEDLPAEILQIVYPLGYWELIEAHAGAQGLDPYLVAALMAQESTFTAEIRSSANARGLMQIMPATGRQYARKLGIRSFTTASLARPDINVRIGVRYLKDLVDRFGAPYYALAAYNAGEARVSAWLKEHPDLPPDEFIDNIPFPETQNYVKRILGTAEDYRRLYGTGLLVPGRAVSAAAD